MIRMPRLRPATRVAPARWLLGGFGALIAPERCVGCGRPPSIGASPRPLRRVFCPDCFDALPWLGVHGRCRLCQTQLPCAPQIDPPSPACPSCLAAPTALVSCLAAWAFEAEAVDWIHRLKYPARGLAGLDPAPRRVLDVVASDLTRRAAGTRPDRVVPVPLHARRLRERGFNPACLLARSLAARAAVALDAGWLRRLRDTPSQTRLDREGRLRNVRDAFACVRRRAEPDRCVWLVDDVVTTGATLQEAAAALRRAGVREIVGLCAARAAPVPAASRVETPARTG